MKKSIVLLLAGIMTIAFSSCNTAVSSPSASTGPSSATSVKTASPAKTVVPAITATPIPDTIQTAEKYFRFEADIYKKYAYTTGNKTVIDSDVEFLKGNLIQLRETNEGYTSQTVYSYNNGSVSKVIFENDRAYRIDFTGLAPDPAVSEIMIMEPVQVGTKWTLADGSVRSVTSVSAQVDIPAGKYTAVEITTDRANLTEKQYYAAGTGLVKSSVTPKGDGSYIEYVLEKITTGVPFEQTVRFYFPDGQNEKLVYIDRTVSLRTNELFGPAFTRELKSPPGNGEIGASFTAGVNLLGLEVRNDGTLAYINLSKQFVDEMNAGTTYESLILHSVISTVGNYFTVANVLLEIEGQPYKSGHFMFVKDEVLKVDTTNAVPFE